MAAAPSHRDVMGKGGGSRLAQLPRAEDASRFLRQLRYPTRSSAARAVIDGIIVSVILKKRGARPLLARAKPSSRTQDPHRSLQVSAAVDAGFGLIPVAPTCLRRSLTLMRELNRTGLAATLHVGVRSVGEKVEAHAWVQAGEVVLNDEPDVAAVYVELAAGELERLLPLLR